MKIQIQFDGGCQGNPGRKYGSYRIHFDGTQVAGKLRIQFGHGTNNEAEFNALQAALDHTVQLLAERKLVLDDHSLLVLTDSMIVRNRLMKKNKIHKKPEWIQASQRMYDLACACLGVMRRFHSFQVEWRGREHNVAAFGH